jgi:hypothetical protein
MLLGLVFCSSGRILGKGFTDGAEFHADRPRCPFEEENT